MTGKLAASLIKGFVIIFFIFRPAAVISEVLNASVELSIVDTFHEWVAKLNDAMYEEPKVYSDIHADRMTVVSALEYPLSNRTKLELIDRLWEIYYTCIRYQFLALGPLKLISPDSAAVLEDAVLHLDCMICVSPRLAHKKADWFMIDRLGGVTIKIVEDEFTIISSDNVLSIYKVKKKNTGIYWCQSGSAKSQDVYVHVLGENDPTISVHPSTSRVGPFASKEEIIFETITLATRWTNWNQCTTCGIVGRRTKWGSCFVKTALPLTLEAASDINVILSYFVSGLPCRSVLLPKMIRDKQDVQKRPNEIMTGLCKVPCVDEIFEVRDDQGILVLMVNNSAGLFSTLQIPPKLPPMVVRQIKWPLVGQPFIVTCPGSMTTDTPTEWKINRQKRMAAFFVNSSSKGRVHIDMRDRIVFKEVLPSDGHRYVCYQNNKIAGIVSVIPVEMPPNIVEIDAILLLCFLGIVLLTYVARTFYFNRRLVRAVEKDF